MINWNGPCNPLDQGRRWMLNNEILLEIFNMLSKRDLLSVMQTCRTLLRFGLVALLKRPYVFQHPQESWSGFYSFLRNTHPNGYPAFRDLTIRGGYQHEKRDGAILCLEWLLYSARWLSSLGISTYYLESQLSRGVPDVVSSMTSLKKLRIEGRGEHETVRVLRQLRAPLQELSFRLRFPTTCPLCLLSNFRGTLQEVMIFDLPLSTGCADYHAYNVTSLSLPGSRSRLSALMPTFPKITLLQITQSMVGLSRNDLRIENVKFQAQSQDALWPSLEVVVADEYTLWVLGIQREVHSVVILNSLWLEISQLQVAFATIRPRHLHYYLPGHNLSGLPFIFVIGMDRLQRLDLVVDHVRETPPARLVSSLRS